MHAQVINYGQKKLLLLGSTAFALDSKKAQEWARQWFTDNWKCVRVFSGRIHLGSLAVFCKAAADYVSHATDAQHRILLACVEEGRINHSLGIK